MILMSEFYNICRGLGKGALVTRREMERRTKSEDVLWGSRMCWFIGAFGASVVRLWYER